MVVAGWWSATSAALAMSETTRRRRHVLALLDEIQRRAVHADRHGGNRSHSPHAGCAAAAAIAITLAARWSPSAWWKCWAAAGLPDGSSRYLTWGGLRAGSRSRSRLSCVRAGVDMVLHLTYGVVVFDPGAGADGGRLVRRYSAPQRCRSPVRTSPGMPWAFWRVELNGTAPNLVDSSLWEVNPETLRKSH